MLYAAEFAGDLGQPFQRRDEFTWQNGRLLLGDLPNSLIGARANPTAQTPQFVLEPAQNAIESQCVIAYYGHLLISLVPATIDLSRYPAETFD